MSIEHQEPITRVVVTICSPTRTLCALKLDKGVAKSKTDHVFYDANSNVLSLQEIENGLKIQLVLDQGQNIPDGNHSD